MTRLLLPALLLLLVAVQVWARPKLPILPAPSEDQTPSSPFRISNTQIILGDTINFGGTQWAPDSLRWEAVKDSVWTFDSGVGSFIKESGHTYPDVNPYKQDGLHGGMEGWIGTDRTYSDLTFFRRLGAGDPRWRGSPCVGLAVGLQGQYSLWAGVLPAEAESLCYSSGKGYGNNWNVCIEQTFSYAGGAAQLSFQFRNETEDGFDFTRVYCDPGGTGDRAEIQAYTGDINGIAQIDLRPGIELPTVAMPVKIQFCVSSDPVWSDEDGFSPTQCGAFAIDNVTLTGAIEYTGDFETDDGGWTLSPAIAGPGGEWSNLAYMGDFPLPGYLAGTCAIRDSVLVFFNPNNGGHPFLQDNLVKSPWIDLERYGVQDRTGFVLNLDGYFDLPLLNYIFVQSEAQWFPDTCGVTGTVGVSPWANYGFVFNFGSGTPICDKTFSFDFTGIIPLTAKEVRVAVGVINFCRFFSNCTEVTNTSPWLDNIRLGAYKVIFNTIQEAIDAAAPGDTVWVPPGTYSGNGDVDLTFHGKSIVLKSMAGAETTIIDGSYTYRGFVCDHGEDSTAAVIGFTFRNCRATDGGYPLMNGGAVYVGSGSSMRFEDCVFSASNAYLGGAAFVELGAEPTFLRCSFSQNTSSAGGAVAASGGNFQSCLISDNHAERGGGLFLGGATLLACIIRDNTADFGGGIRGFAFEYAAGTIELRDCLVVGNTAIRGGGMDLVAGPRLNLSGTTVTANVAELAGGVFTYNLSAHRCIFWGNGADSSGADVFLANQYSPATFICSAVDSSQIGGSGQAIFQGPQVFSDPLFCLPSEGDYTLAINSPCLPAASPCDSLIGALGMGCGFVSIVPPPVPEEPPFLKTPGIHTGPNPFTQTLTIYYLSPFGTDPRLEIFSVDGRLIGKWALRPGSGTVNWDGKDPIGKPVASGIYLVRYSAGDLRVVRRVVRITG